MPLVVAIFLSVSLGVIALVSVGVSLNDYDGDSIPGAIVYALRSGLLRLIGIAAMLVGFVLLVRFIASAVG